MLKVKQKGDQFAKVHPTLSEWVRGGGWIEIGSDQNVSSFLRALDEGGMLWEGEDEYDTMDEAFQALEAGIAAWVTEQGIKL